jgi:hypothetical protein
MSGCVALVRTSAASVLADYERLFGLVGFPEPRSNIAHLHMVVNRPMPYPGGTVPLWQAEGVVYALARQGYRQLKYALTQPDPADWHRYHTVLQAYASQHNELNAPANSSEMLVVLAGLQRMQHNSSSYISTFIPPVWAALYNAGRPVLVVLDATTIGNGLPGMAAQPQIGNLLLASYNHAALDCITARLLANETNASLQSTDRIEGDTDLLHQRWPAIAVSPLERFVTRYIGRAATRRREYQCYTSWLYDTEWGQLFRSYQLRYAHPDQRSV